MQDFYDELDMELSGSDISTSQEDRSGREKEEKKSEPKQVKQTPIQKNISPNK